MANILLNNVNNDTISTPFESLGGKAVFIIRGDNFDNGNVSIEIRSSNDSEGRWLVLDDGVFLNGTNKTIDYLPSGVLIRANFSGSTGGASNIFVEIFQ